MRSHICPIAFLRSARERGGRGVGQNSLVSTHYDISKLFLRKVLAQLPLPQEDGENRTVQRIFLGLEIL